MKKPIKVATAKALKEMDYKLSEIADLLGISYRTAWRYTNEDTDDNWAKFVNDVKRLIEITFSLIKLSKTCFYRTHGIETGSATEAVIQVYCGK